VDFCTLSFPASAVRDTILANASEAALRSAHLLLADASPNPADRLWHAASAQEGPDEGVAHALANAAATVRCRGDRARAAELALLAAEMTPTITRVAQTPETPGRDALRSAFAITDAPSARPTAPSACPEPRLLAAALDAGAAGRLDLACTALARIDASGADPATRVHARIAVVDAIGQALSGLDALLAQALADAEAAGDPALLSAVHLRLAWHAHLALGENERARRSANAAVRHAELSGDPEARAAALVMMARIQQLLGVPECSSTLRRALALGTTPRPGGVVNSPQWTAVRFALFADRLDQARHHLRGLTPRAERSGSFEDLRLVLRAAVEIEARAGFGVTAQRLAGRLLSLPGSDGASPGPAWHAAALAELAGGRLEQALRFAELGSESSAQEHDQIFLTRSLQVSGMVRLLLRDAAGAADDLRRVRQLERDQGIGDPATIRYHADLAEAFVALGDLTAAEETITSTRRAASALGRRGVLASLDRAEGVKRAAEGDFARAEALLHRSERTFGKLGLPLERARVLLAQSVVEKRQRRIARSRDTRRAAEEAFAKAGAELWGPAKPGTPRTGGEIGAGRGGGIGSGPPSGSGSGAGPGSAAASAPARSMEPPSTIRRDVARASTLSSASVSTPSAATPDLTAAEQRVVQLVAAGCANREIAATLFLSVKTVESVLTGVYRKLGVRSRTQLCLVLSSDTGPPLVETG
jgi:DNA-binding CsgD family transcriptional regulator